MKVTLQLPDPLGRELQRLPDRDDFASFALRRALEERRRELSATTARKRGRLLDPAEVRELGLPPAKSRERELAWRRAHREELQERFAGQWVVLEGEKVVAASPNAAEAAEQARTQGVSVPFIFYVDEARPGVVDLGM